MLQKGNFLEFFLFVPSASVEVADLDACMIPLAKKFPENYIGVSGVHFKIEEGDSALREAIYAVIIALAICDFHF